jgi:nicotinate-nucleotide adenylyltransferase
MSRRALIGVYGGTFDPIHKGHVLSADELCQRLALDELRLIPCHQPPHRPQPLASSQQRLAMVELAIAGHASLTVDDRELQREGPSYTVETLKNLREELGPDVALCWVMGADAFAHLDSWYQWEQLLVLAHIVVLARPGESIPMDCPPYQLLEQQGLVEPAALRETAAGKILQQALTPYPVSATAIRQAVASQQPSIDGLSPAVLDYIKQNTLYRKLS